MCASTEYDDLLVCMEGRHNSCVSVNPISAKGRRRLGLNEFACKKSCVALISNATTSDEARNTNVGLDADMGPKCERSQPTISGYHSRKFRQSAAFCDGFGVCGRTKAYGIQACIQKKSIQYFVPFYFCVSVHHSIG